MREVLEETGVQTGRSASSVCARNYTYTSFLSVLARDTHTDNYTCPQQDQRPKIGKFFILGFHHFVQ